MIGPRLRLLLRWAAYAVMVLGPAAGLFGLLPIITRHEAIAGFQWQYWAMLIAGIVSPVVQGGILLVLLSIDERVQNRGQ